VVIVLILLIAILVALYFLYSIAGPCHGRAILVRKRTSPLSPTRRRTARGAHRKADTGQARRNRPKLRRSPLGQGDASQGQGGGEAEGGSLHNPSFDLGG